MSEWVKTMKEPLGEVEELAFTLNKTLNITLLNIRMIYWSREGV